MEMKIPEIEARAILMDYTGFNNVLLDWKNKLINNKNFALTRPQAEYVIRYQFVKPKVARKHIKIVESFGEKLKVQKDLPNIPDKIWVEKILCESDDAYNIWGKIHEKGTLKSIWVPKTAIIPEEKVLNRIIDYSKYDVRPPFAHQKIAVEKLLANDRFILADEMGAGKTGSAVIASLESGAKKILVICTASLKINWKREIGIYTDKKVLIINKKTWDSSYDYYIINYDILKNFHTTDKSEESEAYKIIVNEKFDLAIVDEAHKISNSDTLRSKLLTDILIKIPKVWLLTGTPITSRPINYYNLLKIIKTPIASNWRSYVRRYCNGYQFSVGPEGHKRKIWNTSGASNLDELRERTKHVVLRRLKTDILDLPEKLVTPIFLELKNTFYDEELEEFMRITNNEKNKESISVTLNRLMPIRQLIATEKIPITCELIDDFIEEGKKVIVFTNFTATLDTIYSKYKNSAVKLDGRMSMDKRQESVDRFQNDPKIRIFVSNLIAGGVGITLTAAEGVIMNDLSFVPADHLQAEDRTHRPGQKNNVLIYYPIFDNTIERIVYNILERKKNIIDQVMGDGEYSESFSQELMKELF